MIPLDAEGREGHVLNIENTIIGNRHNMKMKININRIIIIHKFELFLNFIFKFSSIVLFGIKGWCSELSFPSIFS